MQNTIQEGDYKIYYCHNYYYPIVYLFISIIERNVGWENEFFIEVGFVSKNIDKEKAVLLRRLRIPSDLAKIFANEEGVSIEDFLYNEGLSYGKNVFIEELLFEKYSRNSNYISLNFSSIVFTYTKKTFVYNLLGSVLNNEVIKLCENSICSKLRKDYYRFKNTQSYTVEIKF